MQEKILTTAERLIQQMGYNAFSYKDIAREIGIKTSSIHYYYPSKEDLGLAVIEWQINYLSPLLEKIKSNKQLSLQEKLEDLVNLIFSLTLEDEMKMCLGGMLASDVLSLPDKIKMKTRYFFNLLEQWITEILTMEAYDKQGNGLYSESNLPKYILMQLEGSLLMARLYNDLSYAKLLKQFIQKLS
ncbi:TetR/AcrR family transcriptional regulator [Legionella sp. km772]|uniref:TetR/AcrR family transcriptional regulator n=1 Tax=Legionella sp. km772 TaxID=2498111 RepID=UPI000F8CA23C|nr:TetR/AcrR family transcriptional regulator [Legionella sp. km772]RUR13212.1 TetR/AcrR family transcriptional regulator [Legionella sp. km772]